MNTGVVLCTCSGRVDIRYKDVKEIEGAEIVELLDKACSESGLEAVARDIERNDLDSVVFGCVYGKDRLMDTAVEAGVPPREIGFIGLRDLLVGSDKQVVESVKRGLAGEVEKIGVLQSPRNMAVDIGGRVVVYGGDEVARGFRNHLMGRMDTIHIVPMDSSVDIEDLDIDNGFYRGDFAGVEGRIGDLKVVVDKNDPIDVDSCIGCDRCRLECSSDAITSGYRVLDSCDECGDCVDVCPVDAIELGRSEKRVFEADQFLVPRESVEDVSDLPSGVVVYREEGLEPVSLVGERAGGFRKDVWLDPDKELCSSVGPGGSTGCSFCVEICPVDAIWIGDEGVNFDRVQCIGCGGCSAVCPSSVPGYIFSNESLFSVVDSVLYEEGGLLRGDPLDKHVLVFGSGEVFSEFGELSKQGFNLLPFIPVTMDTRGISAALAVYAACKADGVVIVGDVSPAVDMAQAIVDRLGLGEISVLSGGIDVGWLESFYSSVETGNRLDVDIPGEFGNRACLSSVLNDVLMDVDGEVESLQGYPFGVIEVSDSCTLCNACTNACETDALVVDDGSLVFRHDRCTACGLCVDVCPEESLNLDWEIDFSSFGLEKDVFSSEMVCCEECGREFISMEAYRKVVSSLEESGKSGEDSKSGLIKYCEDCRPMFALNDVSEE